jgi:hypothetical protein
MVVQQVEKRHASYWIRRFIREHDQLKGICVHWRRSPQDSSSPTPCVTFHNMRAYEVTTQFRPWRIIIQNILQIERLHVQRGSEINNFEFGISSPKEMYLWGSNSDYFLNSVKRSVFVPEMGCLLWRKDSFLFRIISGLKADIFNFVVWVNTWREFIIHRSGEGLHF